MTEEPYNLYKKTLQSLPYKFKQDLSKFGSTPLDSILFENEDCVPPLVQSWLSDDIHLETVLIIQQLTDFVSKVDVQETLFWPEVKKELLNATPFVKQRIKGAVRYKNMIIDRELNL